MYADPNSQYMSQKEKEALKIGYIPCERADINKAHSPYKYGCNYCTEAHLITQKDGVYKAVGVNNADDEGTQGTRLYCPRKECPYKAELDKYRSYADYDRHARAHWRKKIKIF
jgi:hypothetical protein